MNPKLLAVQNQAWTLKETCDDLAARKLSERDLAALDSIGRDLDRLQQKLVGIRDKRKRSADVPPDVPPDAREPVPLQLTGMEDNANG